MLPSQCAHIANAAQVATSTSRKWCTYDKEECSYCFRKPESEGGIFICLDCRVSCCVVHWNKHASASGHLVSLEFTRTLKSTSESTGAFKTTADGTPVLTKLAVEAQPTIDEISNSKFRVICKACNTSADILSCPPPLQQCVTEIIESKAAEVEDRVKEWQLELSSCSHVTALKKLPPINDLIKPPTDLTKCVCRECSLNENLWMCLECGEVNCGRQQIGGLSGHGHALIHAQSSKHHVAIKLGTISSTSHPDIYCYACDDERLDECLVNTLSRLGIDLNLQRRSVKSLVELQLEQNANFDFSMRTSDGADMQQVSGPFLTGLRNLGNTCYINAVLQVLVGCVSAFASLPPPESIKLCEDPLKCHISTFYKLCIEGLASGKEPSVNPSQWRRLECGRHPLFSTMRQQDAAEFMGFLLDHFATLSREGSSFKCCSNEEISFLRDVPQLFKHVAIQHLTCVNCGYKRSIDLGASHMMHLTLPQKDLIAGLSGKEGSKHVVSASNCLDYMLNDLTNIKCEKCNDTKTHRAIGMLRFPSLVALVAQRMTLPDPSDGKTTNASATEISKSEVAISFGSAPDYSINMRPLKLDVIPPLEDSDLVIAGADTQLESNKAEERPEVDMVVGFGFDKEKAVYALEETGFNVEMAVNWIMDNPGPVPKKPCLKRSASAAGSHGGFKWPEELSQLLLMGIDRKMACYSLWLCNGDVNRSIESLFAGDLVIPEDFDEHKMNSKPCQSNYNDIGFEAGADYELVGFINHKGPTMHYGHYVAHVRRRDATSGKDMWVMFNDERVARHENPEELMKQAYIYILRRKE